MKQAILGLILALIAALPLSAAEPASETHREAAQEMLELMDFEAMLLASTSGMADVMMQQNPALAPYRDVLLSWTETSMTMENFGPKLVDLWTETFTEPELRDLVAFHKTPTGQRALALMPELMQRGMAIGAEVASEHMEELQQMIRERAAELETEP